GHGSPCCVVRPAARWAAGLVSVQRRCGRRAACTCRVCTPSCTCTTACTSRHGGEHGVAVVVRGAELHVVPGGQERVVHGAAGRVAVRLQELAHEGSALLDVGAGRARRGRGGDVCTDAIGLGLHCCSDALLVRLVVHGLCRHGCRNGLHVHGRCVLHVHVVHLHGVVCRCRLHVVHVHVCSLHVVHVHVC